jgi:hypothetical protein
MMIVIGCHGTTIWMLVTFIGVSWRLVKVAAVRGVKKVEVVDVEKK